MLSKNGIVLSYFLLSRKMAERNITIIGGGSTGPILLIYIAKFAKEYKIDLTGLNLHLIDPNGFGNGGIAFGMSSDGLILNTLSIEMSPWDKEKFPEYVKKLTRKDEPYKFHPRYIYRDFLKNELKETLRELIGLNAKITYYKDKALIRRLDNGKFSITDESGKVLNKKLASISAENIVITVGYGPRNNFEKYRNNNQFIDSLYPNKRLKRVEKKHPKTRIGVIGAAAALYDFLIDLPLNPHDVDLTVFSGSGKEPLLVRDVENEHLLKDLRLAYIKSINSRSSIRDINEAIKREYEEARLNNAGPSTWVAFRIMRVIGNALDKVNYKVARGFLNSYEFKNLKRTGGPTSQVSHDLLVKYNPTFIARKVTTDEISFNKKLKYFEVEVTGKLMNFDYVVNASGHGRHTSPILEDLKRQGLASVNKKLGVLKVDKSGYRLKESRIACIGPATHFGVDGIESFAFYSEKLAKEILGVK